MKWSLGTRIDELGGIGFFGANVIMRRLFCTVIHVERLLVNDRFRTFAGKKPCKPTHVIGRATPVVNDKKAIGAFEI